MACFCSILIPPFEMGSISCMDEWWSAEMGVIAFVRESGARFRTCKVAEWQLPRTSRESLQCGMPQQRGASHKARANNVCGFFGWLKVLILVVVWMDANHPSAVRANCFGNNGVLPYPGPQHAFSALHQYNCLWRAPPFPYLVLCLALASHLLLLFSNSTRTIYGNEALILVSHEYMPLAYDETHYQTPTTTTKLCPLRT